MHVRKPLSITWAYAAYTVALTSRLHHHRPAAEGPNPLLAAAADLVVKEKLVKQDATGGIVALDREGNIAMSFNTPGMYRGFLKSNGETGVFIFGDE